MRVVSGFFSEMSIVVGALVDVQRQEFESQPVQKTFETPEEQIIDKVVDLPLQCEQEKFIPEKMRAVLGGRAREKRYEQARRQRKSKIGRKLRKSSPGFDPHEMAIHFGWVQFVASLR